MGKVEIAEESKTTMTIVGYIIAGLGLFVVPLHIIFTITADEEDERFLFRLWATIRNGTFCTKLKDSFKPIPCWGPTSLKERTDWQVYTETHSRFEFLPNFIAVKLKLKR